MRKTAITMTWRVLLMAVLLTAVWVSGPAAKEYPSLYRGVRPLAMGGRPGSAGDLWVGGVSGIVGIWP